MRHFFVTPESALLMELAWSSDEADLLVAGLLLRGGLVLVELGHAILPCVPESYGAETEAAVISLAQGVGTEAGGRAPVGASLVERLATALRPAVEARLRTILGRRGGSRLAHQPAALTTTGAPLRPGIYEVKYLRGRPVLVFTQGLRR